MPAPAAHRWFEEPLPPRSFRSLFKWGAPDHYRHPGAGLVELLRQEIGISQAELLEPRQLGLEPLGVEAPVRLPPETLAALSAIVGERNLETDVYARLRASYGQAMIDVLRLRQGIVEHLPDVVLHPRHREDVQAIVAYCHRQRIPLTVVGGHTSVTRGCEALHGGIALQMSSHMNRILAFNETNQTVRLQPGIYGPALEAALNQAPARFGAKRAYTCGHFPQSFEYSTVGGWVATRGAGQNSTYYGKIEDLVLAQEVVTPVGVIRTGDAPRQATGPDIDQILIGSEGAFGVWTEVTLKVFRYQPGNRRHFSYMFKSWQDALQAGREILQCEAGFPSVFRLSDPEETAVALRMYGVAGTPAESLLHSIGYRLGEMCLLLGWTEGGRAFSQQLRARIGAVCRAAGAFPLSAFGLTRRWEHNRFQDPYLRDDLGDIGVLIDTLECATTWERLPKVHAAVRAVIKARPHTICMAHISHAYPQGANLYFIFITRLGDIPDYLSLQYAVLDAIQASGAAISHHHGLGKALAPWLPAQVGEAHMALLRNLKQHFDPHGIMNPGGTLALDLDEEQRARRWGLS